MKSTIPLLILMGMTLTGCDKPATESVTPDPQPVEKKVLPATKAAVQPSKKVEVLPKVSEVRPELKVGMTESEFISAAGEPTGTMMMGKKKILSYGGVMVAVVGGVVQEIPPAFLEQVADANADLDKERETHDAYRKKGMVQHDGRWVTPGQREQLEATAQQAKVAAASSARIQQATRSATPSITKGYVIYKENGEEVDHSYFLDRGDITIVLFYSDYYTSCAVRYRTLISKLRAKYQEDRKIDI
ncbi:MAG: hypothetical protein OES84_06085, partial [Kiritimatiellaceae bacterium]|nr:hypothetical protein [Kiritimatiellaceae bacterium]